MREQLSFLKICSVVVKIGAWFFLLIGVVGGVSIIMGKVSGNPRWLGVFLLAGYVFLFFFLHLIAKIPDLLTKIISEIKKE